MRYKILCFCEDMISLHSHLKKKKKSLSLKESGKKKKKVGKGGVFSLLKVWWRKKKKNQAFFSSPAINWLLQTHLASCRDDWQPVVHVIANQVTDTLKTVVFGAYLQIVKGKIQKLNSHINML